MSQRQWVRWPRGTGGVCQSPPPAPSVPRVSRLLVDARTVLGGPSAHRTLASLGKLAPMLRAAGRAGEEAKGPLGWGGGCVPSLYLPTCVMGTGRGCLRPGFA